MKMTTNVDAMTLDEFLHHLDNTTGEAAARAASEIVSLQERLEGSARDYKMVKRAWREYRKQERTDRKKMRAAHKRETPPGLEMLTTAELLPALALMREELTPQAGSKQERVETEQETRERKILREHLEHVKQCNCPACAKRREYYAKADKVLHGSGPVFLALHSAINHMDLVSAAILLRNHEDAISLCMGLDGFTEETLQ